MISCPIINCNGYAKKNENDIEKEEEKEKYEIENEEQDLKRIIILLYQLN
jgi:hypothetical protein